MKKRLLYGLAIVLLALSVLLVVSQAMNLKFLPSDSHHTFLYWAICILIFILIVTLGFILFRESVKLYYARQSNQEGSRIRTKLVVGALALSLVPVFFLVVFSYVLFGHNMNVWFTKPAQKQHDLFNDVAKMLHKEMQDETDAQALLLASQPETHLLVEAGLRTSGFLQKFCDEQELESAAVLPATGGAPIESWNRRSKPVDAERIVRSEAPVRQGQKTVGTVQLAAIVPLAVAEKTAEIERNTEQWNATLALEKDVRRNYLMLMALITLFVLFVAVWIALFFAKQISVPITALLGAAGEVRRGNLAHRVDVRAVDELGSLVRAFNRMTEDLDANGRELDRRRRFIEAILESIPTGVISIASDGSIKRVNRALSQIFPPELCEKATRLEDLFSREDTAEVKYLMKRARRTGLATRQLELQTQARKLHLAVTVSALEERLTSGFVVVLEDTSELLRAQKAAAWHEVARRVAHEIKNPLTPIAISADRISRQIDRLGLPAAPARILRECAATILKSVDSVKTLVDEFSQFARFPAAQPVRCDLNQVVSEALAIFKDRLDGISIRTSYAAGLPPVNLDREQFQRVVVNLVDNAAEAMQDSLVKSLFIATQPGTTDIVELVVADSGPGVTAEDKEKLFLPYFSTKNRGTGLGLAIVSHIVAEHNGHIRVEDNRPSGARFTVEIPALLDAEVVGQSYNLQAGLHPAESAKL
jgi:two-component system nitrogen regulation sensor histidine kinase NtrY